MKIGFEAKRFFHNFTGLGNYSRFIVKALAEHFPEEELKLYTPSYKKGKSEVDAIVSNPNVDVIAPQGPAKLWKSYWRSYKLGNIVAKDKVDVFHGLSNELPSTAKDKPYKKVVTIHDLLFLRYPEYFKRLDRSIYNKKFKHACEVADTIIAVSEQTSRDIQEFYHIDADKISVVYQGCHPIFKQEYSVDQLNDVKKKYNLPDQFMLNVGTVEPRKNALLILQAMRILGDKLDVPLVIVGKATAYKEELEIYIHKHNLHKKVFFIENCAFEDLPKIYRSAQLFVYPSVFEGFGIPIVEAIASGIPVISSAGGCFAEAGGKNALYVDPYSPEALSEAISKVLDDQELKNTMIQRGIEHIQKFEPLVIAKGLMDVYSLVY